MDLGRAYRDSTGFVAMEKASSRVEAGTSGFLSISDSVHKVPRVVTGESGIVLCGGMELRLPLELFTG